MGSSRHRREYYDSSSDGEKGSESETSSGASDKEADNWVSCDRCSKWRRIPALFARQIQEDTPWYCENNPNKAYANCSVAQELTNEEIDAAEVSPGDDDSDLDEEESAKRRRIPAVWQLLKDNVMTHRKRRVQDEDDIMICHCKPVYRGGDGCGPDCINRMLCIECVPGFCPSEDKCTNQMFSKKMYAKLEIRRAGPKGSGLFALDDIKAGQFVIEYIGEVLEEDEYQRRKEYYQTVGQRHYYFMNIGNGEVIDACRKGNISRFINHSCEPNCETQKWLVHGELAIGLFAVRDIPRNTELTFDYNFERYGDKPQRCYCGSGNCRKIIGGQQDNFDVSRLPPVDPDAPSYELPPVMLGDDDLDPNMRMLLEWRVGAKVDKAKEMGMLTRLERLCKARGVVWSTQHFYGQEPLPAPAKVKEERPQAGASSAGNGRDVKPEAKAAVKAERTSSAEPGPLAAVSVPKVKEEGGVTAKQAEGATHAAGVAKLRIEDARPSAAAAAPPAPVTTPATTPDMTQIRGPKALFKQWKILQQQESAPAPVEEKPAAVTPSSPPSPLPPSPPSPQSPPSPHPPRPSPSLEDDVTLAQPLAVDASKHVPLRKRLRRLPPRPPPSEEVPAPAQNGAPAPKPESAPEPVPVAPVPRKASVESLGRTPATVIATPTHRSASPPAPASGARASMPASRELGRDSLRDSGREGSRRLRSEIDRRLEEVVGASGRLKDPSRPNIIKVLRLFNLCDIGGQSSRANGYGPGAGGRYFNGRMDGGSGLATAAAPGGLTARQRARMADLSLLLDVVLKTSSSAAKKEFVTCGLLTQLHQAMGRNTGKEYSVILRKVLRVVEALPLEANDVYAVRSAHGTFADMLRQLSSNTDYDVRTKAAALLKKFPPSAVTDQRLLQIMAAPPMHFGHGPRGGGMGRMGGPFGSMLNPQALAMQQQFMMQQQMMKQQQMMRMKEAAAAAAAANAQPLRRTSSGTSLGEDGLRDTDTAGHMGLPPLAPGHPRGPAPVLPPAGRPRGGLGGGSSALPASGLGGSRGAQPSPLGLPPRPPSPADAMAGANGHDDTAHHSRSKRRKHSHGSEPGDRRTSAVHFADLPLPGPPPRPPLGSAPHHRPGVDGSEREPPGPPPLPLPLPPPPPIPPHQTGRSRWGAIPNPPQTEPDPVPHLPKKLSMEQLFSLQRPPPRPTALPSLQGAAGDAHPHGEPTSAVMLFALGLYGGHYAPPASGPDSDSPLESGEDANGSPIIPMPPWSPILELPPPPPLPGPAAASSSAAAPATSAVAAAQPERIPPPPPPPLSAPADKLPLPPQSAAPTPTASGDGAPHGVPMRVPSVLTLAGLAGPSPAHQQGSPALHSLDLASRGPGSASSTPAHAAQEARGSSFAPPGPAALPPGSASAAAAAVPLVVPISSLSDWSLPAAAPLRAEGRATGDAAAGGGAGAAAPAAARASPRPSPEVARPSGTPAPGARPAELSAAAMEEWLRPVSTSHADVWDAPDGPFESYVADMVRHRLGKYMQPEHPSRITHAEAQMLHAKIRREVVAKERRAWDERRGAGVFKPIERHKLEANLKEFVRSTIKRMRDREKEKAAGAGSGGGGHTPAHGHGPSHRATPPAGAAPHRLSSMVTPPSVLRLTPEHAAGVSPAPGRPTPQAVLRAAAAHGEAAAAAASDPGRADADTPMPDAGGGHGRPVGAAARLAGAAVGGAVIDVVMADAVETN